MESRLDSENLLEQSLRRVGFPQKIIPLICLLRKIERASRKSDKKSCCWSWQSSDSRENKNVTGIEVIKLRKSIQININMEF